MATPSYIVSPPEVAPERGNHVAPVGIVPVSIFEVTALRAALPGLVVAVLAVLFGFVMGKGFVARVGLALRAGGIHCDERARSTDVRCGCFVILDGRWRVWIGRT